MTEADISKEIGGNHEDPFNLTASSRQNLPLNQNYGRNNRAQQSKGMPRKQFAAINHFEQPEDFLAQRLAETNENNKVEEPEAKPEPAQAPAPVIQTHHVASSPIREDELNAPTL